LDGAKRSPEGVRPAGGRAESMAQRMARHPFLDSSRRCRPFDGLVVNLSVQMVATPDPGLRVHRHLPCGEQPKTLKACRRFGQERSDVARRAEGP